MFFKEGEKIADIKHTLQDLEGIGQGDPRYAQVEKLRNELAGLRSSYHKKIGIVMAALVALPAAFGLYSWLSSKKDNGDPSGKPAVGNPQNLPDTVAMSDSPLGESFKGTLQGNVFDFVKRFMPQKEVNQFASKMINNPQNEKLMELFEGWCKLMKKAGHKEMLAYFLENAVPKVREFGEGAGPNLHSGEFLCADLEGGDDWFKSHNVSYFDPVKRTLFLAELGGLDGALTMAAVENARGKQANLAELYLADAPEELREGARKSFDQFIAIMEDQKRRPDGFDSKESIFKMLQQAAVALSQITMSNYETATFEERVTATETNMYLITRILAASIKDDILKTTFKIFEANPGRYFNIPESPERLDKDLIVEEIKAGARKFLGENPEAKYIVEDEKRVDFMKRGMAPVIKRIRELGLRNLGAFFQREAVVDIGKTDLNEQLGDSGFFVADLDEEEVVADTYREWFRKHRIAHFDLWRKRLCVSKDATPEELDFSILQVIRVAKDASYTEKDKPDKREQESTSKLLTPVFGDVDILIAEIEAKAGAGVDKVMKILTDKAGSYVKESDPAKRRTMIEAWVYRIVFFLGNHPKMKNVELMMTFAMFTTNPHISFDQIKFEDKPARELDQADKAKVGEIAKEFRLKYNDDPDFQKPENKDFLEEVVAPLVLKIRALVRKEQTDSDLIKFFNENAFVSPGVLKMKLLRNPNAFYLKSLRKLANETNEARFQWFLDNNAPYFDQQRGIVYVDVNSSEMLVYKLMRILRAKSLGVDSDPQAFQQYLERMKPEFGTTLYRAFSMIKTDREGAKRLIAKTFWDLFELENEKIGDNLYVVRTSQGSETYQTLLGVYRHLGGEEKVVVGEILEHPEIYLKY